MKKNKKWLKEAIKNSELISSAKLNNLIDQLEEPEQEKVVVPQFVADYIEIAKQDITLMRVFDIAQNHDERDMWEKEYEWIRANHEKFARAWLDGYLVEKFRRVLKIGKMYFVSGGANYGQEFNIQLTDNKESAHVFESEQEAKDLQSDTGGELEEITK